MQKAFIYPLILKIKILLIHDYCCDAILEYKRTGETVWMSGKLELEKDCEFDDVAGEYVLRRY